MNFYQKRYIYYLPIYCDTGDKMIEFEKDIGTNAGKVWNALKSSGALNKRQLTSKTNLKEQELSASIGWLAREGKIDWDEKTKTYKLK